MVTKKQNLASSFCEEILDIQFEGNINNFNDVNNFLSLNLENAKMIAEDAKESYYSEFMY
jgi:hypothetical protein